MRKLAALMAVALAVVAALWAKRATDSGRSPQVVYKNDKEAHAALVHRVRHVWPSGRGHAGKYSWSNDTALFELSPRTLAWKWSHPNGRYFTLTYGSVMDSSLNIYLTAADAIRKFSPGGMTMWEHRTLPARNMDTAVLMDGALYSVSNDGHVYAINIESGMLMWQTWVAPEISEDNGFVNAFDGVVVTATNSDHFEFNKFVRGLNASDGSVLWTFRPDVPVWNFMASFPADGTLVFQDYEGKAYRLKLHTGELMWKAGGNPGTWTDGTLTLGPNTIVYAVSCSCGRNGCGTDAPGDLRAHRLSDGQLLWHVRTPRPPNVAPAVGNLFKQSRFSVVMAVGQQVVQGGPTDIYAYDAETGDLQWRFEGPKQKGRLQAGDEEGLQIRGALIGRPFCLPNPWSAPNIDASGTIFIGNQDGTFFALRDSDGNGVISGHDEVSSYDTEACFAGSAGPAIGPGVVVAVSCDSLFVFTQAESVKG